MVKLDKAKLKAINGGLPINVPYHNRFILRFVKKIYRKIY